MPVDRVRLKKPDDSMLLSSRAPWPSGAVLSHLASKNRQRMWQYNQSGEPDDWEGLRTGRFLYEIQYFNIPVDRKQPSISFISCFSHALVPLPTKSVPDRTGSVLRGTRGRRKNTLDGGLNYSNILEGLPDGGRKSQCDRQLDWYQYSATESFY